MAFPTIPTTGNGRIVQAVQANETATRTFPAFSGLTYADGDLLLAIVVAYRASVNNATFSGWTNGFTELTDLGTANASDASATMAVGVAYKWASGTESGSLAVTQAATVDGHVGLFLMAIPGAHASTVPEVTALATGTTGAADPAALNPTNWDVEDTLWVAVGGRGELSTTGAWTGDAATVPANYGSLLETVESADAQGAIAASVAFRQNATASEDVAAWGSVDVADARNCALVIAVRPAPLVAVKTGAGIMVLAAGGERERPPETYVKAGLGRMGVRPTVINQTGKPVLSLVGSGVSQKVTAEIAKTGAGVRGHVGAGADAGLHIESGAGISSRVAAAGDAVSFAETGTGSSGRVAAGADQATFSEIASGITGFSGSGVSAKVGAAKAGTGIAGLAGTGMDAVAFTESGLGISGRAGAGVSQRTVTKAGAGVQALVGSGSGEATFTETGAGVLAATAGGVRESAGGAVYVKAGVGQMGVTQGVISQKTGAGVTGRSASGVSESGAATVKTGVAVSARVASGARTVLLGKSGIGVSTRGRFEQGSQAGGLLLWMWGIVFSTVGVSEKVSPSGTTYTKAGAGVRGSAAAGARAVVWATAGQATLGLQGNASKQATHGKAGSGVLSLAGSGQGTKAGLNVKAGAGVRGHTASGADASSFVRTAAGILERAAAGADAAAFTDTGAGVLNAAGSGAKQTQLGTIYTKAGTGVRVFAAAGAKTRLLDRYGTAISVRRSSAADAVLWQQTGAGIINNIGSGEWTPLVIPGDVSVSAADGNGLVVIHAEGPGVALEDDTGPHVAVSA